MKKSAAALACWFFGGFAAYGVILLDTGDPMANKTPPNGALSDSGWQYEGDWGGYLGTPIAPNFFISAAHLGQAATQFVFQGNSYSIVASFSLPGSDFLIWQVNGTFPYFAPLYTKSDETGRHLVVIGRGTQRGTEVVRDDRLRGWDWGAEDNVRRWGENDVADIVLYGGHDLIYATFDQHVQPNDHPNEAHLSRGDSGGALFLNDSGVWKLGGINFAVDDLFSAPDQNTSFAAAIFDAQGFYTSDGHNPPTFSQIMDPTPTGFYDSRISSELSWICSVIADPQVGREGNLLTVTYSRLIAPSSDIGYIVEQSDNLADWSTATVLEETIFTSGDIERIKAKIDVGTSAYLFARVRVTRPQETSSARMRTEDPARARRIRPLATSDHAAYKTDTGRGSIRRNSASRESRY
jgi:hypothetical protein